MKLRTTGIIEWNKCLGGSDADMAWSVEQTSDDGYIVAGFTMSEDGDVTGLHSSGRDDYWIVKLSGLGNIQWQKCYGGSGGDDAFAIAETYDLGFIICGVSGSNDGDVTGNHSYADYWVLKLDEFGGIQWQKCLGGTNHDDARAVQQTYDGGYIVGGYSRSQDGDLTTNYGINDWWIVKLDPYLELSVNSVEGNYFSLSPNPTHSTFTISFGELNVQSAALNIYDMTGREVHQQIITSANQQINCHFAPGTYFVKVTTEAVTAVKKLVIE